MDPNKILAYESKFHVGQIIDGVIDPPLYFQAPYRIAWFLKEAYTNEQDGFHIKKYYGGESRYEDFFRNVATPTWHPIIYCSYGILNDFLLWDDMPYIKNRPELCGVISQIAIINANKSASKTGTYTLHKNLLEGFRNSIGIINLQIQVLQPEIHIFGGTFYLYKSHLGITEDHFISNDAGIGVWEKDKKLFIDAYHPANRLIKREKYVDSIVNAVAQWAQR